MQGNNRIKREYGAVTIVEATFVFPIMFFVVFFMLMLGSVYFQQARVENIVIRTAIETAARCENPMQDVINGADAVPTSVTSDGIKPYRYIFTGNSQNICNEMASKMKEEINSFGSLGFSGMEVHMLGEPSIDLSSYFIVSYIQCEADFYVEFPIRMIFSDQSYNFDFHVGVKQPISDAAEFVRNVSTVQDLLDRSSYWENFMEKFTNAAEKVEKFINGGSANSGNQHSLNQTNIKNNANINEDNESTLISQLEARGEKVNKAEVVAITQDASGRIVWLEKGHLGPKASGLMHIVDAHAKDFAKQGISEAEIPQYIMTAVKYGTIVGYQGRDQGRPIYEFTYEGTTRRIAITIGSNGYIVGANPQSVPKEGD